MTSGALFFVEKSEKFPQKKRYSGPSRHRKPHVLKREIMVEIRPLDFFAPTGKISIAAKMWQKSDANFFAETETDGFSASIFCNKDF